MNKATFIQKYPSGIHFLYGKLIAKNYKDSLMQVDLFEKQYESDLDSVIEEEIRERMPKQNQEMHLNMQYYMEYCQSNGYVTPQEWVEKHKHF